MSWRWVIKAVVGAALVLVLVAVLAIVGGR